MRRSASQFRGFTLLELIMVLALVAIAAALVAPNLRRFSMGRRADDAARQVLALAQYASAQSAAEGVTYRMYFDTVKGQFWLSTGNQTTGLKSPTNEFGQKYSLPEGIRMEVTITEQFNTNLYVLPNVQQQQVQGPQLLTESGTQPNQLMENLHDAGTQYMEFQPNGRTDPAQITLVDSLSQNQKVELTCATPTDRLQINQSGATP